MPVVDLPSASRPDDGAPAADPGPQERAWRAAAVAAVEATGPGRSNAVVGLLGDAGPA